jgi:uncharacterized protein with LGFP repeats
MLDLASTQEATMEKVITKLLIFFLVFIPVAGSQSASGAEIKNGTSCSKANSVVKIGKKSYRCAKNPYVKPKKLTWTLTTCLTSYRLWKDAKSEYENWEDLAKLAGPEGQKTLDELQASIKSLEDSMINEACKSKR